MQQTTNIFRMVTYTKLLVDYPLNPYLCPLFGWEIRCTCSSFQFHYQQLFLVPIQIWRSSRSLSRKQCRRSMGSQLLLFLIKRHFAYFLLASYFRLAHLVSYKKPSTFSSSFGHLFYCESLGDLCHDLILADFVNLVVLQEIL